MPPASAESDLLSTTTFTTPIASKIWRSLKRWRTIRIGPVSLLFRIGRAVHVTPMSRARARVASKRHEAWTEHRSSASPQLKEAHAQNHGEIAVIVGAGPGLGHALAWKLADAGMAVVLASRNAKRLDALAADIVRAGGTAFAYGCDATDEASVQSLFKHVASQHGIPHLVVYALQNFGPGNLVDIELAAFEDGWRHNCLGAFLVARQAARTMLSAARGSVIFIGSTSSVLGRAGHLNLAVGKFGQRAIAQVLARELWPKGIHVAHLVIDADIHEGEPRDDEGPQSNPADIAEILLGIHRQPKSAWTSEIDVRPSEERFWEHC